jgi:hypothetical protein
MLVLDNPESFAGQITGFTGTAPDAAHSDVIDLVGINYDSSSFAESYNSTTGLLTITDGTHSASITFDNFNATLDFASDGNGGTLITDPPTSGSAPEPSGLTTASSPATADTANGKLSATDPHSGDSITDNATPDSSDHHDSLTPGHPDDQKGHVSADFDLATNDNHADPFAGQGESPSHKVTGTDAHPPAQGETPTAPASIGGPGDDHFVFNAPDDTDANHSKWTNDSGGTPPMSSSAPAASIGGPANDHFVFTAAANGEANSSLAPHQENIEHLPNAQDVQELHALMASEVHGDMPIYHSPDGVGVPDVTAQLQHIIQAGHLLH